MFVHFRCADVVLDVVVAVAVELAAVEIAIAVVAAAAEVARFPPPTHSSVYVVVAEFL